MCFSDSCLQCIFYKARFFFLISRPIHWKHTSVVQNQSRESKCKTFHLRVSCSSVVLGRSKPCFQPYTFHSEGTGKMTCRQRLTQDAKLEADMKRKLNLIQRQTSLQYLNSFQGTHKNKAGRKGSLTKQLLINLLMINC